MVTKNYDQATKIVALVGSYSVKRSFLTILSYNL